MEDGDSTFSVHVERSVNDGSAAAFSTYTADTLAAAAAPGPSGSSARWRASRGGQPPPGAAPASVPGGAETSGGGGSAWWHGGAGTRPERWGERARRVAREWDARFADARIGFAHYRRARPNFARNAGVLGLLVCCVVLYASWASATAPYHAEDVRRERHRIVALPHNGLTGDALALKRFAGAAARPAAAAGDVLVHPCSQVPIVAALGGKVPFGAHDAGEEQRYVSLGDVFRVHVGAIQMHGAARELKLAYVSPKMINFTDTVLAAASFNPCMLTIFLGGRVYEMINPIRTETPAGAAFVGDDGEPLPEYARAGSGTADSLLRTASVLDAVFPDAPTRTVAMPARPVAVSFRSWTPSSGGATEIQRIIATNQAQATLLELALDELLDGAYRALAPPPLPPTGAA